MSAPPEKPQTAETPEAKAPEAKAPEANASAERAARLAAALRDNLRRRKAVRPTSAEKRN